MKTFARYILGAVSLLAACAIAACNGGTSGTVPNARPNSSFVARTSSHAIGNAKREKRGKVHFTIRIPRKALVIAPLPFGKQPLRRNPKYISPSTQSMTVAIPGFPTATFNLTPSSSNCATDVNSGDLTCQESMAGPTGQQTLTVTLWDQTNGQGNQLATATTSVNIAQQGFTDVPITLGGVVATAKALINGTTTANVPVGTPTSLPVTVEAYDADNNLIIPPGNYSSAITLANSDQSGITSFTAPSQASRKSGLISERFASEVLPTMRKTQIVGRKDQSVRPLDTTAIVAPGTNVTLYYDGDPIAPQSVCSGSPTVCSSPGPDSVTLTAGVNGTSQSNGVATLTSSGSAITEYTIPTAASNPTGITNGPDGALWFTECNASAIGRITTSGTMVQYALPTSNSYPTGITQGPDGALWFTEGAGKIGRITTGGVFEEFPVNSGNSVLNAITVGPDDALWFTDCGNDAIGRITTTGSITEYSIPTQASSPQSIMVGPDGALWFYENKNAVAAGNDKISRITTNGIITEYPLDPGGVQQYANGITQGPDGALWFGDALNLASITTGGTVTQGPNLFDSPFDQRNFGAGITTRLDGTVWSAWVAPSAIYRDATDTAADQVITEYTLSSISANPLSIVVGPDGALWFTEYAADKIGRIP